MISNENEAARNSSSGGVPTDDSSPDSSPGILSGSSQGSLSPGSLSTSERRIITLLAGCGDLTKREIEAKARLSWSTVVKIVSRFEELGLVLRMGTAPRRPEDGGKNAYLYSLNGGFGHVIGIDVEYGHTRLAARSISGTVLRSIDLPSPDLPDPESFMSFLTTALDETALGLPGKLLGIGVGMPLWMVRGARGGYRDTFRNVEAGLAARYGVTTRVHNNIRAYTTNHAHTSRQSGDFILVTVRTGLGFGICMKGEVISGGAGLAGELGHLQVLPDGPECRCGKRGCIETVVNENSIVRDYARRTGSESSLSAIASSAGNGDEAALAVLDKAASMLAVAITAAILTLDISRIVLCGAFGPDGSVFTRALEKRIGERVFAHPELSVEYDSLDSDGFLQGAALLVLGDYYDPDIGHAQA